MTSKRRGDELVWSTSPEMQHPGSLSVPCDTSYDGRHGVGIPLDPYEFDVKIVFFGLRKRDDVSGNGTFDESRCAS